MTKRSADAAKLDIPKSANDVFRSTSIGALKRSKESDQDKSERREKLIDAYKVYLIVIVWNFDCSFVRNFGLLKSPTIGYFGRTWRRC
jgi:hypothetical protein